VFVVLSALGLALCAPWPAAAAPLAHCDPGAAAATIKQFVSAFNRGDIARLDRLFAESPDFRWYSAPGPDARLGRESHRRATLRSYFIRRHRQRERLLVLRVHEGPNGNVPVVFRRRARDLRPQIAASKAAVDCSVTPHRIVVVSIGGPG
jgi:hypothetical protein